MAETGGAPLKEMISRRTKSKGQALLKAGTLTKNAADEILKRACAQLKANVSTAGAKGSAYANALDLLGNPKSASITKGTSVSDAITLLKALVNMFSSDASGVVATAISAIAGLIGSASGVVLVAAVVGGAIGVATAPEDERTWKRFLFGDTTVAEKISGFVTDKIEKTKGDSKDDDSETKPSLKSAGNNKRANELAQEQGYDDAHDLKEDYVGKSNVSKYDLKIDSKTGEIYLENKDGTIQIPTGLYK